MSKTLLRFDEFDYAMTCLFCLIGFATITYCITPYNYHRFNLWQILIICGNVWLQLMSILNEYTSYSLLQIRIALFLVFFGLALSGFVLQTLVEKYRQYLVFPAMKNLHEKVRFMCNSMSRRQIHGIFTNAWQIENINQIDILPEDIPADQDDRSVKTLRTKITKITNFTKISPLKESIDISQCNSDEILSSIAIDSINPIVLS